MRRTRILTGTALISYRFYQEGMLYIEKNRQQKGFGHYSKSLTSHVNEFTRLSVFPGENDLAYSCINVRDTVQYHHQLYMSLIFVGNK